jgi:hypothetical protein
MKGLIIFIIFIIVGYFTYDNYNTFQSALDKNNPRLCEKIYIQQFKDPCYSGIGIKLMNSTYCMKAKDSNERNRCLGVVEDNVTICERINDEDTKENCIYYVALHTNDLDLCNRLTESRHLTDCQLRTKTRNRLGN